MSEPFSRALHPFDIARHPTAEPEVERAILASWVSDRAAPEGESKPGQPTESRDFFPALMGSRPSACSTDTIGATGCRCNE